MPSISLLVKLTIKLSLFSKSRVLKSRCVEQQTLAWKQCWKDSQSSYTAYSFTSEVWELHCSVFLQHLLSLAFFIIDSLTSIRWYLLVVLNHISLVITDIEHISAWPFLCLLWKHIKSLSILIGLFAFFALVYMSSLYSLDINPILDMWFANIFTHSTDCLFILLMVFFSVLKLFSFM